ncbi:NAD(P)H-binding protein [Myroides phaeus]|uniref:NAD(P)H-binding protein n=1 Tax=Myroides phaeus TaxID=702745 RepID=UPI002DB82E64|nr:NAD(P)H-binding protein [Myroides phaeus]MEC4116435.1 NAD(P)H-binding protein [Myroides phaeus]
MQQVALVSGGNGHLGNNLIRLLLSKGIKVRTTVRNINNTKPFEGLDCEIVYADLLDKASFVKALEGVDVFYAVAANFKLWAKNPQKEIYDNNLMGTRNVIEAAYEAGVKRIVYVSSIAALNYDQMPTKEVNGYNTNRLDTYYNSKKR